MKNIQWVNEGEKHYLKNDTETLIDLTITPLKKPSFILNQKQYIVSSKGFWNPAYVVSYNNEDIVTITHSLWGGKGRIVFSDGEVCSTHYSNKGGLKLRFLKDENELLVYGIEFVNKKPVLTFNIGTILIDAEKILLLSAIGMIIFSTIYKEMAGSTDAGADLMLVASIA